MMFEMSLLVVVTILTLVILRPRRVEVRLDSPAAEVSGPRPRSAIQRDRSRPDATSRVYELRDQGEALPVIAAILNAEGYRTTFGSLFAPTHVWCILGQRRRYQMLRTRISAQRPTRTLA